MLLLILLQPIPYRFDQPPAPEILPEPRPIPTYAEMRAQAIAEGKPLVVFVGMPARNIFGMLSFGSSSFLNVSAGIVIGVPGFGSRLDPRELYRIDMPADATNRQIQDAVEAWRGEQIRNALRGQVSVRPMGANC